MRYHRNNEHMNRILGEYEHRSKTTTNKSLEARLYALIGIQRFIDLHRYQYATKQPLKLTILLRALLCDSFTAEKPTHAQTTREIPRFRPVDYTVYFELVFILLCFNKIQPNIHT